MMYNRFYLIGENMSLPTYAKFYKDDKIVGVGFCNPGWSVSPDTLKCCIKESMDDAWDRYREDFTPTEYTQRNDKYFTNSDDLKMFDYIKVFDIIIPRDIAMPIYFGKLADEDWNAFIRQIQSKQ